MKKIFSHLYNHLFKESSSKTVMLNQVLLSRRDLNIWKALQNKEVRDYMLNNNKNKSIIALLADVAVKIPQNNNIMLPQDTISQEIKENITINNENKSLLESFDLQKFLLLESHKQKDYISGFLLLNEKEIQLLSESSPLGMEFRHIVCVCFLKVSYHFSSIVSNTLEETMKLGLENLFGQCSALDMSPQLKKILGKRLITILQHFTIIYWNNRNFDFTILKQLGDYYGINCETYEQSHVKSLSFIEMLFAWRLKNHVLSCGTTNLDYHLINPEGFSKSTIYFNEVISKERTGQKHSDLLIAHKKQINQNEITKFYIDIKSYVTVSVYVCRFSLVYNDEKTIRQLINDLMVSFKKYITENKLANEDPIILLHEELQYIKDQKLLSAYDKYKEIIDILTPCMFDPKYEGLKISIALDAGKDLHFDTFYNKIKEIHESFKTTPDLNSPELIELLRKVFPSQPIIDPVDNAQVVKELTNMLVPSPMREQMIDQFENLIVKAITY